MKRRLLGPILVLFAAFVFLKWFGFRWFETSNLYFPQRGTTDTPAGALMPFEEVRFETEDGVTLHGWFIPSDQRASDPTIVLCHGNAGNISHRIDKAWLLRGVGANVFLFDYRGYGQSGGRPSERGLYRDAKAAHRYLTQDRGIPPPRLVFYGESLGGPVAVETAIRYPVGAVILEGAFTSARDMARRLFGGIPVHLIVSQRFDTLDKIRGLAVPLLLLHSPNDEIVPYSMAERLREAAGGPATLVALEGGHNDAYRVSRARYVESIAAFLGRAPASPAPPLPLVKPRPARPS